MHFGLEIIFEKGKCFSKITVINPSQKCITCRHPCNINKANFTLNCQNDHFHKVTNRTVYSLIIVFHVADCCKRNIYLETHSTGKNHFQA